MARFSDLGIAPVEDKKIFDCNQVSISEILNCEIEVLDFIANVKTQHGGDRYFVKFQHDGKEGKFFTNSSAIKSALDQIPKDKFPFTTIIKCTKMGNGKLYQFT